MAGWAKIGNVKGPKGDPGAAGSPGTPGANGASFLSNTVDPTSSDGSVGDSFINVTTGDVFKKS